MVFEFVKLLARLGAMIVVIGVIGLFKEFTSQPDLLPFNLSNPLLHNVYLIGLGVLSIYSSKWIIQWATHKERRHRALDNRVYFDNPAFLDRLYWMFRYEAYKVEKVVQLGNAKAEIFAYKTLNLASFFSFFVCFYVYSFEDGCDTPLDVFDDLQSRSVQHTKAFIKNLKQTKIATPYTVTIFVSRTGFESLLKEKVQDFDQSFEQTIFLMDLRNERLLGSERKILREKILVHYVEDTLRLFLRIMHRDLSRFEYPGWYPEKSLT